MNILEEIAERTRKRIMDVKNKKSLATIREEAELLPKDNQFPLEQALRKPGISMICEVKKASPSKGLIAKDFPYVEIAKAYEEAGASAISVLTEPFYFQGANQYLEEIHQITTLPLLRKDFTIDEYMIYEAKVMGASAVLLICTLLDEKELQAYFSLADELGLSALVEAHDEREVEKALKIGARIIGVNNRNLKTFTVDVENSLRLRRKVPPEILFVSESGIKGAKEIQRLLEYQVDAALVGESLMRSGNIRETLESMIQGGKGC